MENKGSDREYRVRIPNIWVIGVLRGEKRECKKT